MAKYFIDTEFIEGFHKPLFGKRRHFIDLISIGIYCEDGREYYAISNEFNPKDADDWVKENVIGKLEQQATSFYDSPRLRGNCLLYKNLSMIANDILGFIYKGGIGIEHEFYGYYADYDWVLFCSLFGRMIDLPRGFPMYCKDLKQELDVKLMQELPINGTNVKLLYSKLYPKHIIEIRALKTLSEKLDYVKEYVPQYPKQTNEHNALADAKWNYELYKFLKTI